MEHAFHQYVNLRVVYGYTFAQAVTMYLEDDYYTETEKNATWVNAARNRIRMELENADQIAIPLPDQHADVHHTTHTTLNYQIQGRLTGLNRPSQHPMN